MTWNRRLSAFGLALALTLQVSCGVTDTTSTSDQSPDPSFGYTPIDGADLLTCKSQPYVLVTRLIGSKGGKFRVGSHALSIPAGALTQDVVITAEQIPGSNNTVRFGPEGLTFKVPAELTMSYDNCTSVMSDKRIAYTTESLEIIEVLRSNDRSQSKVVISPVDHFSRYAVAY